MGGSAGRGRPRGTSPTVAMPRSARSRTRDTTKPPTTSARAPGTLGATKRSPRIAASDRTATMKVGRWNSPIVVSQSPSFCQLFSPAASVPDILGSSPITTSIAAPKRNPVMTALERNCEIQPIRNRARARNAAPATSVTAATNWADSTPEASPAVATALAATAARAELGPVDICRDVPNTAYMSAPAAAAYRPASSGTWAMPAYPRALGMTSAATVMPAIAS